MPLKLLFIPVPLRLGFSSGLAIGFTLLLSQPLNAQGTPQTPLPRPERPPRFEPPRINQPPSVQPLPEEVPEPLPPPPLNDLQLPTPAPTEETPGIPQTIRVERFVLEGSQVFSQAEIDAVTKDFIGRELSFAELLQAAETITQLYINQGYITTGAYIPSDRTIQNGVVPVQVVEGGVAPEDIRVRFKEGTKHRLNPGYIRKRLALATQKPLNRQKLLEALQLLKLNPFIQDIRAELGASPRLGQSILDVEVVEGKTFNATLLLDNGRSPSVGSFRRQLQVSIGNLNGWSDNLLLFFTNTNGSNAGDLSYTLPINPRNGTLTFNMGIACSKIIEEPFDILDIRSRSRYFELSFRQPLLQTPTREFALGLTFTREESKGTIVDDEIPFPVPGSDFEGRSVANVLRFFQDWTRRSEQSVFALRSQFNFGLPILGYTNNEEAPDGQFFAWRGQAQWARRLAPDTLLLLRSDVQLADRALIPVEQFGLGGPFNVRGYRQDAILSDNGLFASAEVRIPIWRIPSINGLLQVAPFVDLGTTWNRSDDPEPDPNTLASVGVGLRFQMSDRLSARFDWGQRLISIGGEKKTLQEKGLYFSLIYNFF
ncbi:MAG: ShlB/FhaC/HecB family hemolysin secretion/activation protein [Leptolyngbyaceae cyanobacterium HOT.MB2.61]|nr:ShlB/FhaC/HecB family hemolysin secretion/activation protein [Leptolyngbyaceae cyanobacterium HOT.MB2.61]